MEPAVIYITTILTIIYWLVRSGISANYFPQAFTQHSNE